VTGGCTTGGLGGGTGFGAGGITGAGRAIGAASCGGSASWVIATIAAAMHAITRVLPRIVRGDPRRGVYSDIVAATGGTGSNAVSMASASVADELVPAETLGVHGGQRLVSSELIVKSKHARE